MVKITPDKIETNYQPLDVDIETMESGMAIGDIPQVNLTPTGDLSDIVGQNIYNANIEGGLLTIGIGNAVLKYDSKDGFWLGHADFASAPFKVSMAGAITATSATITGSLTTGAGSAIDGQYLGALTVATGALANLAITAGKIANATITATQIAANTITAGEIAGLTITAAEIANNTITAGQITALTITASEIANNTITAGQITASTITTDEIANNTIVAGNIAASTITTSEISGTAGIVGGQIANLTIAAGNITNLTITAAQIANATITGGKVVQNTITGGATGNIALTSIVAGNIAAGTITTTEIAATTIAAGNIAANTITADQIAGGTITATEITGSSLSAIYADLGTITAGNITLDTSGYIKGGQTAYNTGTGFFLGYSTDAYKLSLGNPTGNYMTWDGSALSLAGDLAMMYDGHKRIEMKTGNVKIMFYHWNPNSSALEEMGQIGQNVAFSATPYMTITVVKTDGATQYKHYKFTNDRFNCNSPLVYPIITFTDEDTTPSVGVATAATDSGNIFKTANTVGTTITTFDDGISGQEITIIFTDANTTIAETDNIKLSGAFVSTADDTMRLVYDGTSWFEISRSIN